MVRQKQVNDYDVIFLGSGAGSLVAGTLLARGGRTVLLLKEKGYQPSFTRDGYRFSPFSNFSEKIIRGSSSLELLRTLSLQPLAGRAQKVFFQVLLPEARVDLFCHRAELHGEWKREFPKDVPLIEQLYGEMATALDRLKREGGREESWPFFPIRRPAFLNRFLSSESPLNLLPFSREFRTFLDLQLMGWGSLYPDRYSTSQAAYLLLHDPSSEWVSNVDLELLKESLLAEYLRSGGRVEEIDRVEEAHSSWRKGFALVPGGGEKVIRSKFLVLNSPLHRTIPLDGKGAKRLSAWAKRVLPKYVLFPVFIAVQDKVIPVGMGDLLISIRDLEKPLEGGNLLFIALSSKGEKSGVPEGKRTITVGSLVLWEDYIKNEDRPMIDEHRAGVMEHLGQLIPFFENYVEFIDSDRGNELIRHWSYPHFLYESTARFRWREGLTPLRIAKNLYYTGIENFPYLGFEGEVLGGWMVARQILQKCSRSPQVSMTEPK